MSIPEKEEPLNLTLADVSTVQFVDAVLLLLFYKFTLTPEVKKTVFVVDFTKFSPFSSQNWKRQVFRRPSENTCFWLRMQELLYWNPGLPQKLSSTHLILCSPWTPRPH